MEESYELDEQMAALARSLVGGVIRAAKVEENHGSAVVRLTVDDGATVRDILAGVSGNLHDEAYMVFNEAEAAPVKPASRASWSVPTLPGEPTVNRGDTVTVTKGRKVPLGTQGVVFWLGASQYGTRLGLKDARGEVHWTYAKNVSIDTVA